MSKLSGPTTPLPYASKDRKRFRVIRTMLVTFQSDSGTLGLMIHLDRFGRSENRGKVFQHSKPREIDLRVGDKFLFKGKPETIVSIEAQSQAFYDRIPKIQTGYLIDQGSNWREKQTLPRQND